MFARTSSVLSPPANPRETELTGQLASIFRRFPNGTDNETIIARLSDGRAVRGVVDDPDELREGSFYLFTGRWDEHHKYGWQFVFSGFAADIPRDANNSVAYLVRHCKGIGMTTAKKLVEVYGGEHAVRMIQEEPERVIADGHMREKMALAAAQSLREVCDPKLRHAHLEVWNLLKTGGGGFPRGLVNKLLKKWGETAPDRIRRDPFTLLVNRMPGCGFLRCDRLYLALGHRPDRLKRQALAAWYELKQHEDDTWMDMTKAFNAIRDRIGGTTARPQKALALAYKARWIDYRMDAQGGHWVAEREKALAERKVAHRLRVLREVDQLCWPAGPFADLSDHQQERLGNALTGPVAIVTGSPGTGKTFTAAVVIKAIADAGHIRDVAVCAPTGKAAVRIGETMRAHGLTLNATTIHKLLNVRAGGNGGWKFAYDEDTPLPYRFVVVDEVSMLDTSLAASLLRACAPGTHLLLIGDVNQLSPVGHGAPLRDLLDAGTPAARLTEIRRNSGLIVETCARIKDGHPL
jgi:exodeoxyribonuclease V alpha subunit